MREECVYCSSVQFIYNSNDDTIICQQCGKEFIKNKFFKLSKKEIEKIINSDAEMEKLNTQKEKLIKEISKLKIEKETLQNGSNKKENKNKHLSKKESDKKIIERWYRLRARSLDKKYPEVISCEDFLNWYKSSDDICQYCNGEMKDFHKMGSVLSIDRMDNSKGYIEGNLIKACMICNTTKNQYFSFDQFKQIIKTIIEICKPSDKSIL